MENGKVRSLYIHIPFCEHICAYCDFVRVGYHHNLAERFIERFKQDLAHHQGETFDTVYIGGGTPSALSTDQLETVLAAIHPYLSNHAEFTMEANPENLSEEKIQCCHRYGVSRISLGVQSIQPKLLHLIGRRHTLTDVERVISQLRHHGIDNISADGIYGLPTQTLSDFQSTVQWMIDQHLPHISLYALTIEPNSAFGRKHFSAIDNSLEGEFYQLAVDMLTSAGYHHYEISNFCLENKESRHNLTYWHYDDFAAIGPGASGKEKNHRYTITRNIHRYLTEGIVFDEDIDLTKADEMFEFVMMGLRLKAGIELRRFRDVFDADILSVFQPAIEKNLKKGWLNLSNTHLSANEAGRLFLHDLLIDFMEVEIADA